MVKSDWFGSNGIKKVIYIIVICGSIGVCFLGLQTKAKQEQQRKVEYATATIKNEAVKIKRLNKQILELYQNDQEEFLIEPIEVEKLNNIERDSITLRTEAADFGLENKDFSIDTSEVTEGKQLLLTKIDDIKNKRDIQKQVTALLVQAPSDWAAEPVDVVINEQASVEGVAQIRNEISETDSAWSKAIIALLNEMTTQAKAYTDLKQAINAMAEGETLTAEATLENIILVFNQLDQIKNEMLKKELSDRLDVIDKLLEKQLFGNEEINNQEEILPSE
ncbi:hypothetical protein ATZ33_09755 [Enterococcus silesiacus]|uniref:Uncharacterized protein n=1 Tax=Enterococcus silesiacus TaxID=332949 RepID=A0A0S3KBG9_9ENTE|nr:hypothetical protein [Enterococcus silesiacus]ALS01643.1 hypothetical protein ATZ33_09755 [Enterococcus silesiacus]OJG91456.1 hypothetical protein RV15_GL000733 [Enterococcus silesiacus]